MSYVQNHPLLTSSLLHSHDILVQHTRAKYLDAVHHLIDVFSDKMN